MRAAAALAVIATAVGASPASAQDAPAAAAIHAGLALCRGWVEGVVAKKVTKPTFDADGFVGGIAGPVRADRVVDVPDGILPAELKRFMTDYWHLDAGTTAGVFVAASRFVPRCEVVAGGGTDLQPLVRAELASTAFTTTWTRVEHKEDAQADMASDHYRLTGNKREELLVSSAIAPGGRTDRAQFLGTLMYQLR